MRASLVLLLGVAIAVSLQAASPLTFYLSDKNGVTGAALPNTYALPDTRQFSASSVIVKVTNTSTSPIYLPLVFVADSPTSTGSQDFTVTGFAYGSVVAPGSSVPFTVNFVPKTEIGPITGYLKFTYAIEQNGCTPTSPITLCPGTTSIASILTGTATAPLVLSYGTPAVNVQPFSTPIQFGNVSDCASSVITFTLQNETSIPLSAPVSLPGLQYIDGAFSLSLDKSTLPQNGIIAAGASMKFTVTFAPGNPQVYTTNLIVGSNSYPLQGSLLNPQQIGYVYLDPVSGAHENAQPATPIVFGNLMAGANGSSVLTFMVTNQPNSTGPVVLATPSVSGTGFAITGAPAGNTTLQPGDPPLTFKVTFSANTPGNYPGTLSIGCQTFTLAGQSVASPLPTFTFQLSEPTLTSQQQVNLSIQFASASAITAIGMLKMTFTPYPGLPNDPAIFFTANSDTTLNISVAAGSQTATYQGQSSFTFQTGTTAGAIAFTVTFPNTASLTSQSFPIAPATIQITSAQAVRQNPNLIVTLNGYDNTYSAGALSFVFYDLKGNAITTIPVNATSNFHQYFFTSNQAGGAFALQASFPVTGDVTQVGSIAATLTNSAGQTSTTQTFQ